MFARLCLPLLIAASPLLAQALTPERLDQLAAACPQDGGFRALKNALAQNDGRKLAEDWSRITAVDAHFTKRIADEPVANQMASGRCWMFSALNMFRRTGASRLGCDNLELSQNYLFFYDKLEKANLFLDAIARTRGAAHTDRRVEFLLGSPVQEGGNWQGFVDLVKKYGVVPKDVMPETFSSSNSAAMNQVLFLRLKVAGVRIRAAKDAAAVEALKLQAMKDVYRILAMHLGVPPSKFTWRHVAKDKQVTPLKAWTPKDFYKTAIGADLDDFVALYSIPTLAYQKKYEIDLDRALLDAPNMFFVNCPLEVLKEAAKTCVLSDRLVWFGADVSQDMQREEGLLMPGVRDFTSLYGMDFAMDRRECFESRRSVPNHNMVFTGVDMADGKPVKWLVENSWGDKGGKKGYYTMMDGWFDHFVQVVVVPRSVVPKAVLDVFGTQAELLPPWDPMMSALNVE
ncbi:aminopeptidase C [Geothrix sp. 21YS21S-2]|uniref:aminopeptidase C n=1 Tax=Geothrix sp. 21YS21S-2 TaxID=3068893 RepID=UPI0027BAB847|nr:C1 family peptidase [Geothrix sp. 21YS21S-2]